MLETIKALGRKAKNFDEALWRENRERIVTKGLCLKFSQNEKLKEAMLTTGDEILAECAVKDRIWGIGLSMKDPDRFDQAKWNGSNLLGKCLMAARQRIREEGY